MTPSSNHLYDPTFSIETLRTFRYFHGYRKEISVDRFRKKSKRDLWSIFVFSMCLQINIFYACDHKFLYLGELIICLRILRTFEIASKLFIRYYETKSSGHHFDTQSFCFTPPNGSKNDYSAILWVLLWKPIFCVCDFGWIIYKLNGFKPWHTASMI